MAPFNVMQSENISDELTLYQLSLTCPNSVVLAITKEILSN